MKTFDAGGIGIAYIDEGNPDGDPILLIHGFASNTATNWIDTGWVKYLASEDRRVIAIDNRGHGHSEKLYGLDQYGARMMGHDAFRLLDHLGIERSDILGYSMGARIGAFMCTEQPQRIRSMIFAGLGYNMVRGMIGSAPIAHALKAPTIDDVKNETAKSFRAFAESTGSDLKALAACIMSARERIEKHWLADVKMPVLVAVGEKDVIAGSPQRLASLMPNATGITLEGRDHMKAVGCPELKQAVSKFLKERA